MDGVVTHSVRIRMIEFAFALWFVPEPASELERFGFLLCRCGFAVAVVLVRPFVVELDSFDLLFRWRRVLD